MGHEEKLRDERRCRNCMHNINNTLKMRAGGCKGVEDEKYFEKNS